ncbi:lytic polysaccharide monooxygenase [Isoptericola sp. 4D.3]|uniref:Lytic polysaccharide monooxygenase n=1 Tax=Isoptericola peretonis TaxID=2918523 RepID=A0ABT0J5A6_9MICO|nr:lytic polysaccharide monooxygenase [Isoptericola sp. 4D.3]
MSRTTRGTTRPAGRWRRVAMAAAAVLVAPLAVVAVATAGAAPAAAHGSVTDPPTRNYGCWDRWGDDFQNPEMAELDPMCWGAWQADPNAMWNWNGLYHEGINHRHEELIPDGRLCSGGRTEGGRYDYLDTPGGWYATGVDHQFTLTLTDGANHGADYLRIYVSKPGYDPTTEPLTWDDLDLLKVTDPYPTQSPYVTDVDLTGYDGRAVLYTIWQASHADQPYYLCSDINIGGGDIVGEGPDDGGGDDGGGDDGGGDDGGDAVCTAEVSVTNAWSGGYQAEVTVTATEPLTGWSVELAGVEADQVWNGVLSGSTVSHVAWNGSLGAGASTTFGLIGSGDPGSPSAACSGT